MNYLKLYRIDVFLITLISYLVPSVFLVELSAINFFTPFLISAVSVNFIYSYNSIADAEIDKINKPNRPMATGLLKKENATIYTSILLVISILWPIFIYKDNLKSLLLSLCFPVIGILYSNPIYPFKKRIFAAALVTSLLLILPSIVSLIDIHAIHAFWYVPLVFFSYCLFIIPLKDIEDVEGDVLHNAQNWANKIGSKRLIIISIAGLLLVLSLLIFLLYKVELDNKKYVLYLIIFTFTGLSICSSFIIFRMNFNRLYRSLIWGNIILGIVFSILAIFHIL